MTARLRRRAATRLKMAAMLLAVPLACGVGPVLATSLGAMTVGQAHSNTVVSGNDFAYPA